MHKKKLGFRLSQITSLKKEHYNCDFDAESLTQETSLLMSASMFNDKLHLQLLRVIGWPTQTVLIMSYIMQLDTFLNKI